jgi:hypothetical protein
LHNGAFATPVCRLFSAEVGKPIPGEDTFDRHDQPFTIGGNRLEERFRGGFHVAVQHDFAIVTQDANVHTAGMQVDTAVKLVLIGVESH